MNDKSGAEEFSEAAALAWEEDEENTEILPAGAHPPLIRAPNEPPFQNPLPLHFRQSQARYEAQAKLGSPVPPRTPARHSNVVSRGRSKPLLPETSSESVRSTSEFCIPASQEWTEVAQAAADGRTGAYYTSDPQALARIHARPGAPFQTRFSLLPDEEAAGYGLDLLTAFTNGIDVDAAFALMYISHCLVQPTPLPPNNYAGGWIDLDDVAKKISLTQPRSAVQAEKNRRKVWDFIRFGARAEVIGKRTVPYRDAAGKEIDTRLSTTPWSVVTRQQPVQPCLMECDTVPVRVEIVMSPAWTKLTTSAKTAQYLPFGEVLGAIPGSKAGGAWARSLGLAFLGFCRCHPRESQSGKIRRTRQEWLSQFPAKIAPYQEILDSDKPHRAIAYWKSALAALVDAGILAKSGEAADLQSANLGKDGQELPRKGWQQQWLETPVLLLPGPRLEAALRERSDALPPKKPRDLNARPANKARRTSGNTAN